MRKRAVSLEGSTLGSPATPQGEGSQSVATVLRLAREAGIIEGFSAKRLQPGDVILTSYNRWDVARVDATKSWGHRSLVMTVRAAYAKADPRCPGEIGIQERHSSARLRSDDLADCGFDFQAVYRNGVLIWEHPKRAIALADTTAQAPVLPQAEPLEGEYGDIVTPDEFCQILEGDEYR